GHPQFKTGRFLFCMSLVAVGAHAASTPLSAPPPPAEPGSRTLLVQIDIDLGLAPYVERVLEDVDKKDTVVFRVNTFGGRIDAAVRIRDAILNSHAYTVAFIDKRAISAGALISLATDAIV